MCILGSEEEKAEDLKVFGDTLNVEKHIERYDDQLHGWLSARADLEDEKVRKSMKEDIRQCWSPSESAFEGAMKDRLLLIPIRSSWAVALLWPLLTALKSHAMKSSANCQ